MQATGSWRPFAVPSFSPLSLPPIATVPIDGIAAAAAPKQSFQPHGSILVVDDEDDVRAVLVMLLEALGFQVVQAKSGTEALTAFDVQQGQFRLVLLDVTMPGLSGPQIYEGLCSIRADVRVALMSGYSEQDSLRRFPSMKLVGFLHKPFGRGDLVALLERALVAG